MSGIVLPCIVLPCITDHLVLRTIDGAADLLIEEVRAMASIHSIRQASVDTVECTIDGPLDDLAACGLYATVAVRDLDQSLRTGALSNLPHPVRFRVGTADPAQRREVINATEQRFGWVNRPGDWDVNLVPFADGWIAEIGPLSWTRRFGLLERLPWSTNLIVAEVLIRLAKIRPGQRVVDPFCGTGTILQAVRRQHPTTHLLGLDHDPHALRIAANNALSIATSSPLTTAGNALTIAADDALRVAADGALTIAGDALTIAGKALTIAGGDALRIAGNALAAGDALKITGGDAPGGSKIPLARGTAEALPLGSGSVDRVIANLPFGKQVGSHRANRTLYPAVLGEIDRVLSVDGRAVLLTEDKRLLHSAIERQRALKVVRQRVLRYNGATPTAYVLSRTRLARTTPAR
ncbi:putative RNA methylase family UPF0020 [Kribbella pratensis]|uniref:RNA methylase family UPF0020 n=1 Tax=Kribbella pratensis TaxID=2512112 RepID=A0ABY2FH47_9ACTN|nr:hypothetical protein [Kribbella pratensis]TDW90568.1 putative RNA methylase family UPF0020 [Kribbella pratensis]